MSALDDSGNKQLTTKERDKLPIWQKALDGLVIKNTDTGKLEHLSNRQWLPFVGGSTASFLTLLDTPASYVGKQDHYIRVNSTANGLVLVPTQASGATTWSELIGNNASTSFSSIHTLNERFVQVSVYNATTGHRVETGIDTPQTNEVITTFSVPPATNEYIVVVTK